MSYLSKKLKLVVNGDQYPCPEDTSGDQEYKYYYSPSFSEITNLMRKRTPKDYQKSRDEIKKEDAALLIRWDNQCKLD